MSGALAHLDRWLSNLLATLLALAVVTVLWQVASRHVLADPSSFTDELVRFLLIWLGLLGGAHATGRRLHLAIDLLPERLSPPARRRLGIFLHLLIAGFAGLVMIGGGGHLVTLTLALGQTSSALGVPLGWIYTVLPIAGSIIVLYAGAEIRRLLHQSPAVDGDAS